MKQNILAGLIGSTLLFSLATCDQGKREPAIENSPTGSAKTSEEPINTEFETPTKLKDYVTGDWIAEPTNASRDQDRLRIEFTRDGKYTRYTGGQVTESGLYRVNEQHRVLYLEAGGDGQPAEWDVTIESDHQMTLKMRNGSAHGEGYSFTYVRQD